VNLRIETRGNEIHVTIEPPAWPWRIAGAVLVALAGLVAFVR
jgi:hypothetical protein